MTIFEINADSNLTRFRAVPGGGELYESEIEDLVWNNTEELLGEALLVVKRQAVLPSKSRPDIVALDSSGRVVVIEVKRDVDRSQLAQCLEYAGWARSTSSDELARMYHLGEEQFYEDWRSFTDGDSLKPLVAKPRLILVARDFTGQTREALQFLRDSGVPVSLIEVGLYKDHNGRKFLDVTGVEEPPPGIDATPGEAVARGSFKRITIADLIERGLVEPGDQLEWDRPRLGTTYRVTVTDDAQLQLEDGTVVTSPSAACKAVASVPAYNGWNAWTVVRTGKSFYDIWYEIQELPNPRSGS